MLAHLLICIFSTLGGIHLYWLAGGSWGTSAVIPEHEGKPLFRPTHLATGVVAASLFCCALLMAVVARIIILPFQAPLATLGYLCALVFLLRAIGDFRLVGFFKRVRTTRFARFDTRLYSPLCLVISIGVFWVVRCSST